MSLPAAVRCSLNISGWSLSGLYQNLTLYDPPWANENVPSLSFQEYRISGVSASRRDVPYACCPGGYPELSFSVVISRATKWYAFRLVMNIALTYVAFGVFFSDPMTGERLGFSITMMLTLVAQATNHEL